MIKIDDKFFIDADSNCYTLKEKSIIQDKKSKNYGEEVFRDRGYYVTLEGVLNGYLKAQTREFVQNNETDIKELIKEINKQTEFVKKLNLKV